MLQKNFRDGNGGETEKGLDLPREAPASAGIGRSAKAGRHLLNTNHYGPLRLLDVTLGEVTDNPSNSNETRIPRLWKCSRRVWLMQRSVLVEQDLPGFILSDSRTPPPSF